MPRGLRTGTLIGAEVASTLHAFVILAVVEALVRWVRLPRLSHMLGCRIDLGPRTATVVALPLSELPRRGRRDVRCAVRLTGLWPLSAGPCLRRALVIGHLLRHHGTAVRLGTVGEGQTLGAHAWVEVGGRPLEDVGTVMSFSTVVSEP